MNVNATFATSATSACVPSLLETGRILSSTVVCPRTGLRWASAIALGSSDSVALPGYLFTVPAATTHPFFANPDTRQRLLQDCANVRIAVPQELMAAACIWYATSLARLPIPQRTHYYVNIGGSDAPLRAGKQGAREAFGLLGTAQQLADLHKALCQLKPSSLRHLHRLSKVADFRSRRLDLDSLEAELASMPIAQRKEQDKLGRNALAKAFHAFVWAATEAGRAEVLAAQAKQRADKALIDSIDKALGEAEEDEVEEAKPVQPIHFSTDAILEEGLDWLKTVWKLVHLKQAYSPYVEMWRQVVTLPKDTLESLLTYMRWTQVEAILKEDLDGDKPLPVRYVRYQAIIVWVEGLLASKTTAVVATAAAAEEEEEF